MDMSSTMRPLPSGVYVATLTFFDSETEALDIPTLQAHITRISRSGLSGIVALGSNGEAAHLNDTERHRVISTVRQTLNAEGLTSMPVIVGASAHSTLETIRLCREAAVAGGDYVLVLPPCYFRAAMTEETLFHFYKAVAAASPLPVIIYSFPAVVAGIEMSSDLIIRISRDCENVVGTKFTCGDTGKLARVARAMDAVRPGHNGSGYWCAGGLADFVLQGLVAGGSGTIAGGANITPKSCVEVFKLVAQGRWEQATKLQQTLAEGDWVHTKAGIGGTKAVLQAMFGYGASPRRPLAKVDDNVRTEIVQKMKGVLALEKSL